ncbi:MAG TPA: hypothetical protein VN636_02845, partial [Acidimicrobiia bacterium]|nr:hypothetical protein [Acidimicrobiia bacterium]
VCSVDPQRSAEVLGRAAVVGVEARVVGTAAGDRLVAKGAFDVTLADAADTWRNALPRLMSTST